MLTCIMPRQSYFFNVMGVHLYTQVLIWLRLWLLVGALLEPTSGRDSRPTSKKQHDAIAESGM
jgi:hypothetical protein